MNDLVSSLITGGVVGVICTGLFSLVSLCLSRRWQNQDKEDSKHKELKDAIESVKCEFSKVEKKLDIHIDEAERRDTVQCRARILRFADELINEPDKKHTQGHFEQILGDCTDYISYCEAHPGFKNQIAEQSINIIKDVYNKLCMTHGFL